MFTFISFNSPPNLSMHNSSNGDNFCPKVCELQTVIVTGVVLSISGVKFSVSKFLILIRLYFTEVRYF